MFLILFSSRLHPYSIIVNNTVPDNHARHTVHMNINDNIQREITPMKIEVAVSFCILNKLCYLPKIFSE